MENKDIGALWVQTGKNGEYWSGSIEINGTKQNVLVFKNTYKNKETQPDFKVYEKREKKEEQQVEQEEVFADGELPF